MRRKPCGGNSDDLCKRPNDRGLGTWNGVNCATFAKRTDRRHGVGEMEQRRLRPKEPSGVDRNSDGFNFGARYDEDLGVKKVPPRRCESENNRDAARDVFCVLKVGDRSADYVIIL